MKTRILLVTIAMLLLGAGAVWAAPGAGLVGTDHDFTGWTTTPAVGLCTACHTTHKATGTRLLWNHTLSTNASFSWTDVDTTIGGTKLPTIDNANWTGPTKYWLSCHDGSVAIGDLNWWNGAKRTGASSLNNEKITNGHQIGGGGSMNGNHPVAFPYPYNNAKNSYNGVTTGNMVPLGEFVANPMTSNGIRLFNNAGSSVQAGVSAGTTGMECSSCHDPHNGSDVADDYFLRGKLSGNGTDYICFKCHAK